MNAMKIYIAGPDVFSKTAFTTLEACKQRIIERGHIPLSPLDNVVVAPTKAEAAKTVYEQNIKLITQADVVIANMNSFRGNEPDSGTCFEVGYAVAMNKKVVLYYNTPGGKTLIERLGFSEDATSHVEDFDLPLNIMLAVPCTVVEGSFVDALLTLT